MSKRCCQWLIVERGQSSLFWMTSVTMIQKVAIIMFKNYFYLNRYLRNTPHN
jgi:hypothetical protein